MNDDYKYDLVSGDPISVSDYIGLLNEFLRRMQAKLVGEASEVKKAASGHVYFSLKDEKTGDIINCAIWSSIYRMCGIELEDGMQVIVSGTPDIYRVRGTLTFKVKTVELVGEGALKKAYDKLKEKLSEEGLFDDKRKRPIPEFPQKIGVITSTRGAAIHDFTSNLGRFHFQVIACDSRVEGQEAVSDLLASIRTMKKKNLDVLVIIRGGGSLQSLMAFDNEMLVREIIDFPVPVIAGIGHHQDITLAALAADATESTPTAVATLLSQSFERAKETISYYEKFLISFYDNLIYREKQNLNYLSEGITSFFKGIFEEYRKSEEKLQRNFTVMTHSIYNRREDVKIEGRKLEKYFLGTLKIAKQKKKNYQDRIISRFYIDKENVENRIAEFSRIISANNPARQLQMGYAILRREGKVIKSIKGVGQGDKMCINVSDGEIYSEVKNIKKHDTKK